MRLASALRLQRVFQALKDVFGLFRVWGLGFRILGLGFRVLDFRFGV